MSNFIKMKLLLQMLIAIQFYAQGSYQRSVGNQFQFNVSQTTTSRCLHAVTDAINLRLLRRWVKFPMTEEDRQRAREKFSVAAQPFEGAIGAIDCTFVHIIAPHEHEEAFINHHGNHSLNVQAVSTKFYIYQVYTAVLSQNFCLNIRSCIYAFRLLIEI